MSDKNITIVSGTPYEQGVQQGQQLDELISTNIALVKNALKKSNCSQESYKLFTEKNVAFLQKNYPEQIEEMAGIADGSKQSYDDILLINIPAYFMLRYFSQECSMILARKTATADGKTYLIKNRDMRIPLQQALIEHHYNDHCIISEINGAGVITYPGIGLNNDGLALATTGFWSKKASVDLNEISSRHIFVNIHILLAKCHSVPDVIKCLETTPRMNGLNIITADKTEAAVIETTRDSMNVSYDSGNGILFRTNHYTIEKNRYLNPAPDEYPSTFVRYQRIQELLELQRGKIRFQDLFRVLSDHQNEPLNSICRHPNVLTSAETVSSSLVVLEDGELWTTPGNPCFHLRLSSIPEK